MVTGAGRGSAAVAAALAESGASVVIGAPDELAIARVARSVEARGGRALALGTDLSDPNGGGAPDRGGARRVRPARHGGQRARARPRSRPSRRAGLPRRLLRGPPSAAGHRRLRRRHDRQRGPRPARLVGRRSLRRRAHARVGARARRQRCPHQRARARAGRPRLRGGGLLALLGRHRGSERGGRERPGRRGGDAVTAGPPGGARRSAAPRRRRPPRRRTAARPAFSRGARIERLWGP